MPAHAREVVLELRELDLELPLGAPRVLREDVEDQLGAVDDAGLERVLEGALLRRAELVVDEEHLGRRVARTPAFSSRACPCPTKVRGSGRARCWTTSPTGRHPAVRASSRSSASSSVAVDALREDADEEPALRLRPGCGIGLARSHREIMPRYAPAVTALADRLAARTLELVDIPSESGNEARDPRASARARAADARGRVRRRRGVPLRCPRGARACRSSCSRALRHGAGAGQPPGPDRGRRGPRSRGERHEGRASRSRSSSLRDLDRGDRRRTTSRSCSSVARSCPPEHNPLPALFAGSRRVHEATLAIVLEPTDGDDPGRLPRKRRRAAHVPRRRAGTRRGRGSPTAHSSAPCAGSAPLLDLEPRVAVVGGLEFMEVLSRHAPRRRDRGQRHPRRGDRDAEPPLSARPRARRTRRRTSRRSSPDGATLEIVEQRAAGRVVDRLAAVRALQRAGELGDRARSRRGRTSPTSPTRRASTPSTSGPGHTAYAHHPDEHVAIDGARDAYEVLRRFLTSPIGRRCLVMDLADAHRRAMGGGRARRGSRSRRRSRALDRGEVRVAEPRDGELGGQRVGEEGDPPLLPAAQGRADGGRRPPLPRQDPGQGGLRRARRARRAAGRRALRLVSSREGVVLMPGYVNIGAWVGPRTMVDTWATVGSCAQIGADVHLSGGVGIGGVLEPPQARPVIVEDGAFIGSRAVVVEGVVVGEGAVIAPERRALGLDSDHRRHRPRAGRAPRPRSAALGRASRDAAEGVPGRAVRPSVRAHRRQAKRVDRPQDLAERRPARVRDRDMTVSSRSRSSPTTSTSAAAFYRGLLGAPHRCGMAGRRDLRTRRREAARARARGAMADGPPNEDHFAISRRRPRRDVRGARVRGRRRSSSSRATTRGAAPPTSATRTAGSSSWRRPDSGHALGGAVERTPGRPRCARGDRLRGSARSRRLRRGSPLRRRPRSCPRRRSPPLRAPRRAP